MKDEGTRRRPFHVIHSGAGGWQIENILTGGKAIGGIGYYHSRADAERDRDFYNDRWEQGEAEQQSNPFTTTAS